MAPMARRRAPTAKKQEVEMKALKNKEMEEQDMHVAEESSEETPPQTTISSSSSSSSDSEEESDESKGGEAPSSTEKDETDTLSTRGYSRLFSPYRTLGIVAQGPFFLLPNQNSSKAVLCTAIGDRFQMLQCDRLHPVLVSQAVPGALPGSSGGQHIQHIVSDNSLGVTVVSHGSKGNPCHLTMFQRTQPVATMRDILPGKEWSIVHLMHLGTIKITIGSGEKKDKKENAALCGIIISKGQPVPDDGVPIMGDDDMSGDSSYESESEDENSGNSRGQVVLCVASRTSLVFHKRIQFDMFPTFCPRVAVHPPTYVNKIVIGGLCSKSGREAMILLNVRSGQMIHRFKCLDDVALPSKRGKSEICCLEASPALDTIAVGNSTGMVHLVNTRMDVLLFSLRHSSKSGRPTRITSMSFRTDGAAMHYGIAPLAVGRSDGTISVWDLTPPEVEDCEEAPPVGRTMLCEMERVHYPGGVHTLQYMPQEPLLLSTGTHSNAIIMHIFDKPDHAGRILKERRGHTSAPNCIRYLHPGAGAGGGVLVNSADGNDAAACTILSSGSSDRTLRVFSTARSVLDKEYSQGKGLVKRARDLGMESKIDLLLPPTTAMASSEARSRDWGDLVTIHKDHSFAYVWSSRRGAQSGPVLRQDDWNISVMKKPPPASTYATSVALSTCGNFALVGTKGGIIYKYNMQSGNERGSFPPNQKTKKEEGRREAGDIRRTFKALEKAMKVSNRSSNLDKQDKAQVLQEHQKLRRDAKLKSACHSGFAVTGIAVDGINKTLLSVGSDAKLIIWDFKTHAPQNNCPVVLPAPATKLCHVRDSDLAAVALADFTIIMFDCSALVTVRRFGAGGNQVRHNGPITDLGFSPDGRTLYSSSVDGTIRVWDVPTNSCVDWLGFKTPPTSLTVSPTGEFLATTHTGRLGISLWSDRSFYQTIHVDGSKSLEVPAKMDEPAPVAEVDNKDEDHDNAMKRVLTPVAKEGEMQVDEDVQGSDGPVIAKEQGLITMSGLPPAHWKNLFHLDLVKQRNKPKEPPKKPPSAPFFLQWRPGESLGGEPVFNPETTKNDTLNQDEWDAVWSDDDNGGHETTIPGIPPPAGDLKRGRETRNDGEVSKKPKITHHRSHLASLLHQCSDRMGSSADQFSAVTEHIGTLGPSAIDVSFSTLCSGMHDLDDGLPLLILACRWLIEACRSRERFEAVNAYLHRFLDLHSSVLAGIRDKLEVKEGRVEEKSLDELEQLQTEQDRRHVLLELIDELGRTQTAASEALQGKFQNTLCLLHHFSRMI